MSDDAWRLKQAIPLTRLRSDVVAHAFGAVAVYASVEGDMILLNAEGETVAVWDSDAQTFEPGTEWDH